jgi:hypothetical protein
MQTRRNILLGAGAAISSLGLGAVRAVALSEEPMAAEDLKALSLSCGNPASPAQLISDARGRLDDAIKSGAKPANAVDMVVCPLCHCAFQVSPGSGF